MLWIGACTPWNGLLWCCHFGGTAPRYIVSNVEHIGRHVWGQATEEWDDFNDTYCHLATRNGPEFARTNGLAMSHPRNLANRGGSRLPLALKSRGIGLYNQANIRIMSTLSKVVQQRRRSEDNSPLQHPFPTKFCGILVVFSCNRTLLTPRGGSRAGSLYATPPPAPPPPGF